MTDKDKKIIPAHYSWNSSIFTRGVIDPIKRRLGWVDENEHPISLKESATGQELNRMKETAKDTGKLVATGLAFRNPLTASTMPGAAAMTGLQAYFITEGLKDAYNRVMKSDKGIDDAVMVGLDVAGAIPAIGSIKNGYRFIKPTIKSGVLKILDPHQTIYKTPQEAQRAASLYHTNYTIDGENLTVFDLEATQWHRKPKSFDEGMSGYVTPNNNTATILSPKQSKVWAHEGRHQLDADLRTVDFDFSDDFSSITSFHGRDLPMIHTKLGEYRTLDKIYNEAIPLPEKIATNSENRFALWNDLYRKFGRIPSNEELKQFISNQNRFQLYRDMLFGNGYIGHNTRMNALFHPEDVKKALIEIKQKGGILKRR